MAWVGLGGKAVDRVLRLDFGHAHAFQLIVVEQKGVRKLQPRKANWFRAAEHPQDHLAVCGKIRQRFAVDTAAAGKQVDAPCKIDLVLPGIAQQVGQVVQRGIAGVIVVLFLELRKELLQTGYLLAQHLALSRKTSQE